jgi:hypothetical protein
MIEKLNGRHVMEDSRCERLNSRFRAISPSSSNFEKVFNLKRSKLKKVADENPQRKCARFGSTCRKSARVCGFPETGNDQFKSHSQKFSSMTRRYTSIQMDIQKARGGQTHLKSWHVLIHHQRH